MDRSGFFFQPICHVALSALLMLAGSGCARLKSFRQALPSTAGTQTDQASKSKPAADTYARRMGPPANQRALAQKANSADQAVTDREGPEMAVQPQRDPAPGLASDRPIEVALQPPTAISSSTGRANPAQRRAEAPSHRKPTDPAQTLPRLVESAQRRLGSISNYQVRVNRQERVGESLQPAETVLMSIRRNPAAVRIEWPDGPNKGREALYSAADNGGLLHVNMPGSLVPRTSLPPDSPFVLRSSRHPITEAGFDTIIKNLELALADRAHPASSAETLAYGGLEQPNGFDHRCHKVIRVTPTGETWLVFLDPQTSLPTVVQANDKSGTLLERYVFTGLKTDLPDLAAAAAFDPDQRWGAPKSLLGRLARSTSSDPNGSANSVAR
jgi:hypothetical protein